MILPNQTAKIIEKIISKDISITSIYIAPTYKCLNNCINCPINQSKKPLEIPFNKLVEILHSILDKLKYQLKDIVIEISGGEPFIYPKILNIIKLISSYNIKELHFSSTGETLNINLVRNITNILNTKNVKSLFFITLYSYTPNIHDKIARRIGSFYARINAIKLLLQYKIPVHVKILLMKPSLLDADKIIELLAKIKSDLRIDDTNLLSAGIYGLDYSGNVLKNLNTIAIKYVTAKVYIERTVDQALKAGIPFSLNTIPLCVIDPFYWRYMSIDEIKDKFSVIITPDSIDLISSDDEIATTSKCNICILKKYCNRPWRTYVRIFGDKEFSPIRGNNYHLT